LATARWLAAAALLVCALFVREADAWKRMTLEYFKVAQRPSCSVARWEYSYQAQGWRLVTGWLMQDYGCRLTASSPAGHNSAGATLRTSQGQCSDSNVGTSATVLRSCNNTPGCVWEPPISDPITSSWTGVANSYYLCSDGTTAALAKSYGDTQ
jgi:hypothetical protein